MLPPAPGRFSTTNGWPRRSDSHCADQPRDDVGTPAGGKADDDAHRARRIGLRARDARDRRERGRARYQMQKSTTRKFHGAAPGSTKAIPIPTPLKGSTISAPNRANVGSWRWAAGCAHSRRVLEGNRTARCDLFVARDPLLASFSGLIVSLAAPCALLSSVPRNSPGDNFSGIP